MEREKENLEKEIAQELVSTQAMKAILQIH